MLLTVNRFGNTNISLRRFARGRRALRLSAGDGCESDIRKGTLARRRHRRYEVISAVYCAQVRCRRTPAFATLPSPISAFPRSEERRVGKEGRSGWSPDHDI